MRIFFCYLSSAMIFYRFFPVILSTLILAFVFYFKVGGYALLDNNEGLYAQIPLEMLHSREWIIPTLNGNPYIEKPPLLYWLIALTYKLGGVSETTARWIPATSGFLLCFGTGIFVYRVRKTNLYWLAPLMLGTTVGMIVFSRMIFFESLLALFFSLSLFSFFVWFQRGARGALYLFYTFMGLGILTKGFLVPILIGGVLLLFILMEPPSFRKIRSFFEGGALALFLLITVPWHLLASQKEEGFAWFYFVNEHILRFLDLREPRDYYRGPWFYYIPRLFGYIFPWTLFSGVLFSSFSLKKIPSLHKFLWSWFGVVMVFFSCSQAKANYYIILALPPFLLLMAFALEETLQEGKENVVRWLSSLVFGLFICLLAGVYFFEIDPRLIPYKNLFSPSFFLGSFFILGGGAVLSWGMRRWSYSPVFLVGSLMMFVVCLGIKILRRFEETYSAKTLVQEVASLRPSVSQLYLYKEYEKLSTVVYYAGHPLPLIESQSNDLWYGQHHAYRPELFLSLADLEKRLQDKKPFALLTRLKYKQELERKGFCLCSQRGEKILLTPCSQVSEKK